MDRPVARGKARRRAGADPVTASRILAVFLCLAALYESWSIPLAVILVVPLGVLGVVLGHAAARLCQRRLLPGRPDHHHRPVGEERDPDHRVREGPAGAGQERWSRRRWQAAHLRFRPIIMTSMAFILGVLPLVLASGAGSASQRAIGTGVMGGMITAHGAGRVLRAGVLRRGARLFKGSERQRKLYAHEVEHELPTGATHGDHA